jgi:hypothetical protein
MCSLTDFIETSLGRCGGLVSTATVTGQGASLVDASVRGGDFSWPKTGTSRGHQRGPQLAITGDFFMATDNLDAHERAFRGLVAYPDQLEVRPSPWPRVRLEQIRTEIQQLWASGEPRAVGSLGYADGKVHVELRADGEPLAQQLLTRYGDAVDLTVGFLHFPDCAFPEGERPALADDHRPIPLLPDDLQVFVGNLEVKSGRNLESTIRLWNNGDHEVVTHNNGWVTARVIDPETMETVGGFSGAQTLPLVPFCAAAGESVEIPLLVGTASIIPRLGYAVPPGRWAIQATLGLTDAGVFQTPPLPIAVIA